MRTESRMRSGRAGVSPVIGTVLLLGITVAAGVIVWTFSPPLPPTSTSLQYSLSYNPAEPQWGDGSDCSNVGGVQSCLTLPAIDIVVTGFSPSVAPLTSLQFYFICNQTTYLQSSFANMAWVPGVTTNPGSNAPQLGHCGTYTPPNAAFNRLVFFEQLNPGTPNLAVGDEIVLTTHTFTNFTDDDFHGAPAWCFTTVGACNLIVGLQGAHPAELLNIPLTTVSRG